MDQSISNGLNPLGDRAENMPFLERYFLQLFTEAFAFFREDFYLFLFLIVCNEINNLVS